MSMPEIKNTWTYFVNDRILCTLEDNDTYRRSTHSLVYEFQRLLKLAGFSVVGTSDTYTSGLDGIDRLTSLAAVTWRYNGDLCGSWIVIGNAHIGHMLIILTGDQQWDIYVSPKMLFTGGTVLATRPTATDEIRLTYNGQWICSQTANDLILHLWVDATLSQFRFITQSRKIGTTSIDTIFNCTFVMANQILNSDPSAPKQCCYTCASDYQSEVISYGSLFSSAGYPTKCPNYDGSAGSMSGQLTSTIEYVTLDSTRYCAAGENGLLNEVTGEADLINVGYTIPGVGRRGYIEDLWFSTVNCPNGTTFPLNGSTKSFIQIGVLVFPWNQTFPNVG